MNTETELKVQAYLDNELSPGEARQIAALISSDPAVRQLFAELEQTRNVLSANEPIVRVQDSREFYWSQIQRRIQAEESSRAVRESAALPWWKKMIVPMAGAVGLLAVLLSISQPGSAPKVVTTAPEASATARAKSPIHVIESSPEVSTITFRSESEGVTVVWVSSE